MSTFKLGPENKEFTMKPKGVRPSSVWRENFVDPFVDAIYTLKSIDFDSEIVTDGGKVSGDVGQMLMQFEPLVRQILHSPNLVVDALLDWSEEMDADKEYILDHVPFDQLIDPYIYIVTTFIFPLGKLGELGISPLSTTTKSSPKANGGSKRRKSAK